MKAIYSLAVLSLSVFLSACAAFQTAGQYEAGKQALYEGNYPTALGYFQEAAQANPNAVYGATLAPGNPDLCGTNPIPHRQLCGGTSVFT